MGMRGSVLSVTIVLLSAAYAGGSTIMKPQDGQQTSELTERSERAAGRPTAQRGAGNPVQHPRWDDRTRTIWHLADGHALATTLLGVQNGDPLPRERVPGVVDLAGVTDTGRMNGSLCNGERSCWARGANKASAPSNVS
jgi:hypothetical protein